MNEAEMGLAQSMAQAPAPGGQELPSVEQIVQLLLEGQDPEELVKMGIPPELIMEAIKLIEQQMAAQSVAPEQQGLAAQSAMGM